MATLQELRAALGRADAAGDEEAARAIVRAMQEQARLEGGGQALTAVEPGLPDRGKADAAWQGATQGLSFGFGDEMSAGVRAALGAFGDDTLGSFGERYKESVAEQRENVESARENHPWITGGAELGSGLLFGAAGAARGLAMGGARAAGRAVAGRAAARAGAPGAAETVGATISGNKARLAGMGAAYGGVAGAGYSNAETAKEMTAGVLLGATMGAGLGLAIPAVGAGIKRGAQNLGRRMGLGKRGSGIQGAAEEAARRAVLRDLKRDGLTTKEAELVLSNNRNLMLGDVGDELQKLGGDMMNQPGAGGARLRQTLQSRQEKTFDRVIPELRRGAEESLLTSKNMAVPDNFAEAERAILDRARVLTKDLWDKAYSPNFKPTPWLRRLMAREPTKTGVRGKIVNPRMRKAFQEAEDALDIRKNTGQVAPDHPGQQAMLYDEVQRSLRDQISKGKRGVVAMGDREAKLLTDEHRMFIREMEKSMPEEWSAARKLWAGEAANKEAMEAGEKIFASYADDIGVRLADMNMSQRDNYIIGALRAIENRLGKATDTGDLLRQLRQTRNGKDIVRLIFGDESGFQKFMNFADDELKMLNFYRQTQGSPTYGRQAKGADTGGAVGTLAGMWVGMNLGIAGVPLLGRFAGRKATTAMARADEAKRDAISRMLRTQNPQALSQQLQKPMVPLPRSLAALGLGAGASMPGLLAE